MFFPLHLNKVDVDILFFFLFIFEQINDFKKKKKFGFGFIDALKTNCFQTQIEKKIYSYSKKTFINITRWKVLFRLILSKILV